MSKIIDFETYKVDRNLDPQVRYEDMLREVIKDINISAATPTLTTAQNLVIITWKGKYGKVIVKVEGATGAITVDAHSNDGSIALWNATCTVNDHLRWIGYLFDDNL